MSAACEGSGGGRSGVWGLKGGLMAECVRGMGRGGLPGAGGCGGRRRGTTPWWGAERAGLPSEPVGASFGG